LNTTNTPAASSAVTLSAAHRLTRRPLTPIRSTRRDCRSGLRGINWRRDCLRWRVRATINGHQRYVGLYASITDAAASYATVARLAR
jgi:hypothetical protein